LFNVSIAYQAPPATTMTPSRIQMTRRIRFAGSGADPREVEAVTIKRILTETALSPAHFRAGGPWQELDET
jgi:hypothetical protein